MKYSKGFTFVEIMIVVTIMAISIGLVMSWTLSALDRAELQSTTESIMGIVRKQQISAKSSYGNLPQGIRMENTRYTTFAGIDFESSQVENRQTFSLPDQIHISQINLNGGTSDLIFHKASGETSEYGSIIISHDNISDTSTISINPLGLVDWQ